MKREEIPRNGFASGSAVSGTGRAALKAASVKSRTKALARRLRKGSRMADITADISTGIGTVAELADGIMESFDRAERGIEEIESRSREGRDILDSLIVSIVESRGGALDLADQTEELSLRFARVFETLGGVNASVEEEARSHGVVMKAAQSVDGIREPVEELSRLISSLVERAEISAANAALDAGRDSVTGSEFLVIADAARTYTEDLASGAEEFAASAHSMRSSHESLHEKVVSVSDRVRAVMVVIQGAWNAFREIEETFAALRAVAGELADALEHTLAGAEGRRSSDTDFHSDGTGRAVAGIRNAVSLAEEQETAFAGTADNADRVLEATGSLAAAEDITTAIDGLFAETDAFLHAAEEMTERFDITLSAARIALNETDMLRRGPQFGEGLDGSFGISDGGTTDAVARFEALSAKITADCAGTLSALRTISGDIDPLDAEKARIDEEIARLSAPYRTVRRFAETLGGFSSRMDGLAVIAGMLATRPGAGSALDRCRNEFRTLAGDSLKTARLTGDVSERCAALLDMLGRTRIQEHRESVREPFDSLVAGTEDLTENRLAALMSREAALKETLAGHGKKAERLLAKSREAAQKAENVHAAVSRAVANCERQKEIFREISAAAEKIGVIADELYPGEE